MDANKYLHESHRFLIQGGKFYVPAFVELSFHNDIADMEAEICCFQPFFFDNSHQLNIS